MNQQKLKYARERLNEIRDYKLRAIPCEKEDNLKWQDALDKLAKGEAKISWRKVKTEWENERNTYSRHLTSIIDRLVNGKANDAIQKRNAKADKLESEQRAAILKQARSVEDELVLGDEAEALALLDKFANS